MKIEELLLLLEKHGKCSINVLPVHELFRSSVRLALSSYKQLHNHPFCRYMKSCDGNRSCAVNKHRSIRIAACGHRFCGFCTHGVWEVVQPVMFRGELAAIIYVGGFMEAKRRRELAASGNPGITDLLPPEFEPSRKEECCRIAVFLAEFIRCELELESATFQESGKHHSVDYYCKQVQDLITIRYRENITLEEAAKICKLNPNYLSALLVRKLGKSFRQLLNEQRLTEAESCIKYEQMSIAEIAVSCGFRDANYFSVVFKKYRGITPGEYRDNWVTMEHEMFTRSRNPRK